METGQVIAWGLKWRQIDNQGTRKSDVVEMLCLDFAGGYLYTFIKFTTIKTAALYFSEFISIKLTFK